MSAQMFLPSSVQMLSTRSGSGRCLRGCGLRAAVEQLERSARQHEQLRDPRRSRGDPVFTETFIIIITTIIIFFISRWPWPLRAHCGAVTPRNSRALVALVARGRRNDARAHLHLPRAARLPGVGLGPDRPDSGETRTLIPDPDLSAAHTRLLICDQLIG